MSNFGQSSLDNTKVGAFREHEDSGRGKCFMPGLIRADRNYKGAPTSEGNDEEGREERENKCWPRMLCGFNARMSVFVKVTQREPMQLKFLAVQHKYKGGTQRNGMSLSRATILGY